MPIFYSAYLDVVRCLAAMAVLLEHFSLPRLTGGHFELVGRLGHEAVIVFFVLSGYVISYTVDKNAPSASRFLGERIARLWSALLPALALGITLDLYGQTINPGLYLGKSVTDMLWIRLGLAITFLNESVLAGSKFGTNGPLWSLSYEFFYYVFFALHISRLKKSTKIQLLLALTIIAGPKIILMAPIWLMGVAIHKAHSIFPTFNRMSALGIFFVSLASLFLIKNSAVLGHIHHTLHPQLTALGVNNLRFSNNFVFDFGLGLVFSFHIFSARYLAQAKNNLELTSPRSKHARMTARQLGDFTFPIYVFHVPLLYFIPAVLNLDNKNVTHNVTLLFLVMLSIAILAPATNMLHKFLLFIGSFTISEKTKRTVKGRTREPAQS